jgi:hypothetical protein
VNKSKSLSFIACVLTAGLTACSSGPSNDDVRKAVEVSLEEATQSMQQQMGGRAPPGMSFKLEELEVLGCSKAPSGETYDCDVKMSMDTPMIPIRNKVTRLSMRDTKAGWVIVQGLQ